MACTIQYDKGGCLMTVEHGIGLFFIGCTVTVVGFFIAYYVAMATVDKKKVVLSEVEKSIEHFNNQDTH
jgi:hypothetical protein